MFDEFQIPKPCEVVANPRKAVLVCLDATLLMIIVAKGRLFLVSNFYSTQLLLARF